MLEPRSTFSRPLTLALGATTAMWVCTYIALLFSGKTGGEFLFILAALCLPLAARHAASKAEGALVGVISAALNTLLIGSIVGGKTPNEMLSTGLIWTGGLFAACVVLGVVGASLNSGLHRCKKSIDWQFAFMAVASALVFLMLISGGLVTGFEAGLAVPDWPNSYGHNMLLYPLTEMISPEHQGVFYEHAHRLTGMFVGLTSLMMVVCVWRWNNNAYIRILAINVFIFVCFQGLIGGLRVTLDNLGLAVLHGVIGQLIFTGFVVIAAMLSQRWQSKTPVCSRKDQRWALMLVIAMVLQLILGAAYRHMLSDELLAQKATHILYTHIVVAIAILGLAVIVGIRLMHRNEPLLKKIGIALHSLVVLQLLLGGGALIAIILRTGAEIPPFEIVVTTAHQANGALLLAASFLSFAWARRLKGV